jgi:5-methyltetrahydrofolate--homocysteine methyltransferase
MNLSAALQSKDVFLLDGAIGTELDRLGLMGRARNPLRDALRHNLDMPEMVLQIQKEYARCGCDALTTNTLTMNRIYIETHNVDVSVRDVNYAGVELARQAAGDRQYVLGDMSSTGQLLEPYGSYKEQQFYEAFKEQAEILAKAGVDGFIIETVFDLREALCALKACKDNFPLPVIVSIAFATETKGARTIMGNTASECAERLTDAGADVIGANCGDIDPTQIAEVVSLLRKETDVPILAQPNAGKPRLMEDKTVPSASLRTRFDMEPETFAAGINKCLQAGARLVGGCCGTTPAHINAVAKLLNRK